MLNPSNRRTAHAHRAAETAMTKAVNDLLSAVDRQTSVILLAQDISAAFDTLEHNRLLERAKT